MQKTYKRFDTIERIRDTPALDELLQRHKRWLGGRPSGWDPGRFGS